VGGGVGGGGAAPGGSTFWRNCPTTLPAGLYWQTTMMARPLLQTAKPQPSCVVPRHTTCAAGSTAGTPSGMWGGAPRGGHGQEELSAGSASGGRSMNCASTEPGSPCTFVRTGRLGHGWNRMRVCVGAHVRAHRCEVTGGRRKGCGVEVVVLDLVVPAGGRLCGSRCLHGQIEEGRRDCLPGRSPHINGVLELSRHVNAAGAGRARTGRRGGRASVCGGMVGL
jgi:hypothetical protein